MELLNVLVQHFSAFSVALAETLKLTIISLFFATILGVLFGLFKVSKSRILKTIANVYIDIIRGTPLMVQTMIVFYGISQVLRPTGFSWGDIGGAFTAGAVTLSLNAGAYMAEIVRGGIESVDSGQMEAARSLGLPYRKAMSKIILPQAFRTMLPSIINQFIISLKDTSLISVIGIRELTQNGKIIAANSTSRVMAIWLAVALYYLVLCTALSKIALLIERKVSYGK